MLLLQTSDNHLGLLRNKTQELMDENASTLSLSLGGGYEM
jgi:hypothetical protein